ncbi:alpha/beta hydrolase [Hutsoniella sourekii]|uniref:alpha/beta hydrolase n=1 Tax=Hutsoniella sourekii TaxID=87650 RepID=UPI000489BCD6|nr:alpha/beta hydrolase [Hutsoniella sourekii]
MKTYQESIGKKGQVSYYIQENSEKNPLLIILPGGAYAVTSHREGQPVAEAFYQEGYSTIVLDYSTEGVEGELIDNPVSKFPQPLLEVATLFKQVHQQADHLGIDPHDVTLIGFSAGANLACQFAVYAKEAWLQKAVHAQIEDLSFQQLILAYPPLNEEGIMQGRNALYYQMALGTSQPTQEEINLISPLNKVDQSMPPTFIWTTGEDRLVDPINSLQLATRLHELRVPFELHLFQPGEHGLSLATPDIAKRPSQIQDHVAQWFPLAVSWLKEVRKA